jgi:hypothetical protein
MVACAVPPDGWQQRSGMMSTMDDPRAVVEIRVPAVELRPGDIVDTGEGDWQEVLAVHLTADAAPAGPVRDLTESLGGRYVVVELTDLSPLDNDVYFANDVAMTYSTDGGADPAVTDVVSGEDGVRTYLYTRYEVVTVRTKAS